MRAKKQRHRTLSPRLLTIVEREAYRISMDLPERLRLREDLVAYGRVGLLEALDRFDARHNVNFEIYARHRIRGAMIDGLRAMSEFSRRTHARLKSLALAHDAIGSPPPVPTAGPTRAQDAGVVFAAVRRMATSILLQNEALEAPPPDAEAKVIKREDLSRLRGAFQNACAEDKRLLKAMYGLGRKPAQSGKDYAASQGVNASTISRHHRRALERLRAKLAPEEPL